MLQYLVLYPAIPFHQVTKSLALKSLAIIGIGGASSFSGVAISNSISQTASRLKPHRNISSPITREIPPPRLTQKQKIIMNSEAANYTWNQKCKTFNARKNEYCVVLYGIMRHIQGEFAKQFQEIKK